MVSSCRSSQILQGVLSGIPGIAQGRLKLSHSSQISQVFWGPQGAAQALSWFPDLPGFPAALPAVSSVGSSQILQVFSGAPGISQGRPKLSHGSQTWQVFSGVLRAAPLPG